MTSYRVIWSPVARDDLALIINFIADDSIINAERVLRRIEARAQTLTRFPQRGRVVPELRWHGISSHLEIFERPWRLLYAVTELEVHVDAVLDGRRQLDDLLLVRFMRQ
jgi:plasmid stabilization system protein ParE